MDLKVKMMRKFIKVVHFLRRFELNNVSVKAPATRKMKAPELAKI